MSNSLVGFLELLNNLSYYSTASQNCRAAFLLLWGCLTNLSHDNNKQNCPTVLLPTRGCPTTCHTTTANKKLSYTVVTLPGVVSLPVARQQTKLSNSPVTCLVLSHSLSHDNKPNCPTVLLLAWCCPTACRTSTNQTVQQSCYLVGAIPQPAVHQQTKLFNSLVTCLVLSHSLSYINEPNCPTVLLLAWCRPTAYRTSTNQTVQQSCYLPGAVPQLVVHQRTKLPNSPVTCLVLSHSLSYINEPNCPTVLLLAWCCPTTCRTSTNKLSDSPVTCLVPSHSLSYINKQNCPTVLLPAWCCPTACRTSTNKTVQQSCYLPGAVPQPVVHQQTKLSNSPVTCLVLSHSLSYISTNQTVQQSCYLPGAVPQPVVHQQIKLSNSLVTCLVLSHNLSYINKQNCPTVLLPAWCYPTTRRPSTNKTIQ
uniref:Uncharacterized protein n=1 Tax=Branchiostoma floridae TaxID=7739 RepID=C3YMN1_BRAFL|eukprot:XP_002602360.1 hypothetical protein BRAFLDRAFT_128474 [Branchiostoma floridae]